MYKLHILTSVHSICLRYNFTNVSAPLTNHHITPTTMSSNDTEKLQRLLQTFDAQRLGEGDVSAGANVLAAMACSIANVHRHGARISKGDGSSYRVGSSLLATGPLTSALVVERVGSVLAEFQSSMDSHCNEWELAKEAYLARLEKRFPDERFTVTPTTQSLKAMHADITGNVRGGLAQLLTPLPNATKRALLEHPLLYAAGTQPKQLQSALERSHAGQLLVHDVLRDPFQCTNLADCCLPLIDGCLTVGKQARAVRGDLLLSDPTQVLDEVLREGGSASRLMLRLPWLVDGHAGPSLPAPASATNHPTLVRMEERFQIALCKAWLARLDYTTTTPETLAFDLAPYQAKWISFLQQKEASFPGVSAAARPLFATLLFGLHHMFVCLPKSDEVEYFVEEVEALARVLVLRMCNARAVIFHDASKEKRERQLQTMFEKLSAGPASLRDLTRKHHRLPTNEARDLLDELVTRGQAAHLGGDNYQAVSTTWHSKAVGLTLEA
jgi:hypothetical protein